MHDINKMISQVLEIMRLICQCCVMKLQKLIFQALEIAGKNEN